MGCRIYNRVFEIVMQTQQRFLVISTYQNYSLPEKTYEYGKDEADAIESANWKKLDYSEFLGERKCKAIKVNSDGEPI